MAFWADHEILEALHLVDREGLTMAATASRLSKMFNRKIGRAAVCGMVHRVRHESDDIDECTRPENRDGGMSADWWRRRAIAAAAVLAMALIVTDPGRAAAHGWYDRDCCSGTDCSPVKPSVVKAMADGWHITITPADHPLVKATIGAVIPFSDPRIRRSQDEDFHVCISFYRQSVLCTYVPPFGF